MKPGADDMTASAFSGAPWLQHDAEPTQVGDSEQRVEIRDGEWSSGRRTRPNRKNGLQGDPRETKGSAIVRNGAKDDMKAKVVGSSPGNHITQVHRVAAPSTQLDRCA
jgi:hypothetical protein